MGIVQWLSLCGGGRGGRAGALRPNTLIDVNRPFIANGRWMVLQLRAATQPSAHHAAGLSSRRPTSRRPPVTQRPARLGVGVVDARMAALIWAALAPGL